MTLLSESLIFSAILLAVTFIFLAIRPRMKASGRLPYAGLVWGFVSLVVAVMSGSAAVIFQFVALALIMLAISSDFSWRTIVAATCTATAAVYGALFGLALAEEQHYASLREQYPIQSLEERLPLKTIKQAAGLAGKQRELEELGYEMDNMERGRSWALQRLHLQMVDRFVNAPSFGVRRMPAIRPTKERLMLEADTAIPQPAPMSFVPTALASDWNGTPADDDLKKLHRQSQLDFLNPRGFGWVKSRAEVAGFQSHFFRAVPKSEKWQVRSIELVGLLLHEKPAVYLTANLPRMEELRKAPTRELDAFEAASLQKLQKGETLVVDQSPKGLRMLGAIRATSHCAQCHGGEGGELLGAFAYVLGPVQGKH
jgi:hypothetical protein